MLLLRVLIVLYAIISDNSLFSVTPFLTNPHFQLDLHGFEGPCDFAIPSRRRLSVPGWHWRISRNWQTFCIRSPGMLYKCTKVHRYTYTHTYGCILSGIVEWLVQHGSKGILLKIASSRQLEIAMKRSRFSAPASGRAITKVYVNTYLHVHTHIFYLSCKRTSAVNIPLLHHITSNHITSHHFATHHAQDTRLNNRWLDLRVPSNNAIMRIKSGVSMLFRCAKQRIQTTSNLLSHISRFVRPSATSYHKLN